MAPGSSASAQANAKRISGWRVERFQPFRQRFHFLRMVDIVAAT